MIKAQANIESRIYKQPSNPNVVSKLVPERTAYKVEFTSKES